MLYSSQAVGFQISLHSDGAPAEASGSSCQCCADARLASSERAGNLKVDVFEATNLVNYFEFRFQKNILTDDDKEGVEVEWKFEL